VTDSETQRVQQALDSFQIETPMLGGFHFNDRRYADDDLTFAAIDPYQAFRGTLDCAFLRSQSLLAATVQRSRTRTIEMGCSQALES